MAAKPAEPPPERRVSALAGRQHGVVARWQLLALGLSRHQIARLINAGSLHVLYRGVYAVGHRSLTRKGEWMAAVLACGPGAALSHRSAGALWALIDDWASFIDVCFRGHGGRRSRDGLVVHRFPRLEDANLTRKDGVPVTKPARTLLDLAAVLDRRPLERAVDEAERLGLCRESRLRAVIARHPGHHGSGKLQAVLEEHAAGSTATVNDFEELFLAICDANGLPRPVVNTRVGRYRPDFLWGDRKLIVETDGRGTHGTRRAFEEDRRRDAELTTAGYRVLRFTWLQLEREPEWVAGRVRALLA